MDEPERRDEDSEQGAGGGDRASFGLLFLAAAFALALLLTVVGLLAFAAMTPQAPSPLERRGEGAGAVPAPHGGASLAA
ncbi:hypothetical protein WME99_35475 [Sorangium sp. So ce136]|uniref:hypothetical protein n=1 Tax=Sorangium sp. So ce136 TaxID=3133284 RepID=UPI003F079E08